METSNWLFLCISIENIIYTVKYEYIFTFLLKQFYYFYYSETTAADILPLKTTVYFHGVCFSALLNSLGFTDLYWYTHVDITGHIWPISY